MDFTQSIISKLATAPYEAELGIRDITLSKTDIAQKEYLVIAIQLDPGKQLVPHLHVFDDEICIALTKGIVYLGDAQKQGEVYKTDEKGNVIVDWEKEKTYLPGESFIIPAGKAHHFKALPEEKFIILIFLPETHFGKDRKFVTHPNE